MGPHLDVFGRFDLLKLPTGSADDRVLPSSRARKTETQLLMIELDQQQRSSVLRRTSKLGVFIGFVSIVSVVMGIVVATTAPGPVVDGSHFATMVVLLALLFSGEIRTLKWLSLNDGGEVTASWAFALAVLILPSPIVAVIGMAIASALGDLAHRKSPLRLLFNAAQTSLSLSLAALVMIASGQLGTIGSDRPLSALWFVSVASAGVVMFLANGVLTCVVMALHTQSSVVEMLRHGVFLNLASDGSLVALAPVFVVVADRSVLLLPLVVAVALFVHRNTRNALASEHAANHDVLTELWNRRAFSVKLAETLERRSPTEPCGLVLIDLDDFKDINDRLGHHVGDSVLTEVGARLRALHRPGQVIARLGGDEFAIFDTRTIDASSLLEWAEDLRASLERPFVGAGFPVASAASIGVAMWPAHGRDDASIFQAADLAMYAAKQTGNAVHVYKDASVGGSTGRLDLLTELETAIERSELEMWFQPQIDLSTGMPVAMEALVRWHHPRHGLVMPLDFVPLAEHTELIVALTEYVLDRSISAAQLWQRTHPEIRVAVNASARNLHDLGFPKTVAMVLARHHYPGALLELEITENTVLSHPEKTSVVLARMEPLGVRLTIDDFGTGYSSLTSLRDLPVGTVKIDRSFVRDMAVDAGDEAIVKGIIDLAHNLGLVTIAEGVDSAAASQRLTDLGCDIIQGYLIARPMPLAEAVSWLDRWPKTGVQVDERAGLATSMSTGSTTGLAASELAALVECDPLSVLADPPEIRRLEDRSVS